MDGNLVQFIHRHKALVRQLVLYGLIGGGAALLDTCCYVIFTRALSLNKFIANFFSVNLGISSSFILNAFFNFKKFDKLTKRALSFFAVGYCGLALSAFLLFLGTTVLRLNDIGVKLVSIVFVSVLQFFLNRSLTFTKI